MVHEQRCWGSRSGGGASLYGEIILTGLGVKGAPRDGYGNCN